MSGPEVWCSRNHRVVSFEPLECEGGHIHSLYICRMRVGTKPHGELSLVVPPYSDACREENE